MHVFSRLWSCKSPKSVCQDHNRLAVRSAQCFIKAECGEDNRSTRLIQVILNGGSTLWSSVSFSVTTKGSLPGKDDRRLALPDETMQSTEDHVIH